MKRLEALYEVSKQLIYLLEQPNDAKQRDTLIKQTHDLIEERGKIMETIAPPYSEKEQVIGKEIVVLNVHIEEKMKLLLGEVKQDLKQVKKQKQSNRKYINPYENISPIDGRYHDSKQ